MVCSRACVRYLRRWQRLAFELAFQATCITAIDVRRESIVEEQKQGRRKKGEASLYRRVARHVSLDSIQAIVRCVCTCMCLGERPLPSRVKPPQIVPLRDHVFPRSINRQFLPFRIDTVASLSRHLNKLVPVFERISTRFSMFNDTAFLRHRPSHHVLPLFSSFVR